MVEKSSSGNGPKKIEVAEAEFDLSPATHKLSRNNEGAIKRSKQVGCFYCLAIYSAKEVKAYRSNKNQSAMCAKCQTDSLIPSAAGIELTDAFLRAMRDKWFNL